LAKSEADGDCICSVYQIGADQMALSANEKHSSTNQSKMKEQSTLISLALTMKETKYDVLLL